jgi:DNA-binding transcriptional MerR regulator
MNTHYHVGQFAELGGVTAKTLRFYDELGILRPASVDPRTGYRRYQPQQLEELASILALRNLGVSLAQVRRLMAKGSSALDRRATLSELKRTIEQSIQTAKQSLHWVSAALDELGEGGTPVPVIVKRRPAIPIASVRVKVQSYEETSRFEQELLNAVPPQCVGTMRGVLWHRCADSGSLEAEPFVALKQRLPVRVPCEVKQLSEATLACAYSSTDDENAEQAYAAIRKWMKARGYGLAGPKRELDLGQMLEIQFPLKSA